MNFIIENSPKEGSTLSIDYDKENDKSVVSASAEVITKKSSKKKKEE